MTGSAAAERVEAVYAVLVHASEAHGRFEESELNGVYDQEWARWYAAYAVEHGIGKLIGRPITTEELARFLATSNTEFAQTQPKPTEGWAAYTARRITEEL